MTSAIMHDVYLALPLSHIGLLIGLAGSVGANSFTPHDGMAEPCLVAPPEAMVYLDSI